MNAHLWLNKDVGFATFARYLLGLGVCVKAVCRIFQYLKRLFAFEAKLAPLENDANSFAGTVALI